LSETRRRRVLLTLVALVVFNAVLFAARGFTNLYDTDSTYHLAVAREYARHGMLHSLPWARFSALGPGFGDKELLFHVLLAPFASLSDPVSGGRIALALANAAVAVALGSFAMRAVGPWGALVPVWLLATACDLTLRTLRLRPETLALLLFLGATAAAARRRWLLLGVLSFVFALSYTAVHALLGLTVLFALRGWWVERRVEWRMVLSPALGLVLGLLAHPQLPANLRIFWLQNVTFVEMKSRLDVGSEILPPIAWNAATLNAGWILGMLLLLAARRPPEARESVSPEDERRRLADFLLVAAAAFGLLFLSALRFTTYLIPFATLALLWRAAAEGGFGARVRLPWRGSLPLGPALALPLLAVPLAYRLDRFNLRNSGVYVEERPESDARFAAMLPAGAKVAATWQNTETYVLAAPQGRYLNLLDPVFMAAPFPKIYDAQRALFSGEDKDPVLTAATTLDSDYLAFGPGPDRSLLSARLSSDPRAKLLSAGQDVLYRLEPDANHTFVRDWKVAPKDAPMPPPKGAASAWEDWDEAETPRAAAFEAYVDAGRISTSACVAFTHLEEAKTPSLATYELAPAGPTTVFLDGQWIATAGASDAVLGRGVTFPVKLDPGAHELSISTCPSRGANGFYLVERARSGVAR
jgi:hypothetical protein